MVDPYDINELRSYIDDLNEEIDKDGWFLDNGIIPLTIDIWGLEHTIKYMGDLYLWDTDNDPREYLEDPPEDFLDDHEPLEGFLLREIKKINEQIGRIKLYD